MITIGGINPLSPPQAGDLDEINFHEMISVAEAKKIISENVSSLEPVILPLQESLV